MAEKSAFKAESAGSLMTSKVPVAKASDSVHDVLLLIKEQTFDDSDIIYVVNEKQEFAGSIPISSIVRADKNERIKDFVKKPSFVASDHTDQETVVMEAIKNDVQDVPVVDHQNHFLGAVTAHHLIDVLHAEHLEDFLRFTGIRGRGSHIINLFKLNIFQVVWARLPWLITGLLVGLAATLLTSSFETSLRQTIALVYFIPVMAYMSDAIGTQSETIFIRSITIFKLNLWTYFVREFLIGGFIGSLIGFITGVFGYMISGSFAVGVVVGVSLTLSMTIATILACTTPLVLRLLGKDPAVGSGPFTTAIQDFISLLIYFTIATIVLANV